MLETYSSSEFEEANRVMTVCNACRYCEGVCAVFPAMAQLRKFAASDLEHLANLCHDCGACLDDCQFAPPHEFSIDVPTALAAVRQSTYRHHAWPRFIGRLFRAHTLIAGTTLTIVLIGLFVGLGLEHAGAGFFAQHTGSGAFYAVFPHETMIMIFGVAFAYALAATGIALHRYRRSTLSRYPTVTSRFAAMANIASAVRSALTLRYLDGGGGGCRGAHEGVDRRKVFHHLTAYGFLLCFLATSAGTVYHYLLDRLAPYAWEELPVILGVTGGIGLLVGPIGLLSARRPSSDPSASSEKAQDIGLIAFLFSISLSGFAVLIFRSTMAMGTLLAIHLAIVLAFFLAMPYSRFVHGFYRILSLVYFELRQDRN